MEEEEDEAPEAQKAKDEGAFEVIWVAHLVHLSRRAAFYGGIYRTRFPVDLTLSSILVSLDPQLCVLKWLFCLKKSLVHRYAFRFLTLPVLGLPDMRHTHSCVPDFCYGRSQWDRYRWIKSRLKWCVLVTMFLY